MSQTHLRPTDNIPHYRSTTPEACRDESRDPSPDANNATHNHVGPSRQVSPDRASETSKLHGILNLLSPTVELTNTGNVGELDQPHRASSR